MRSRTALMARGSWVPLALFAAILAAGCSQTPAQDPETPELAWSRKALLFGETHDHANATQHAGMTTPNFRVVGHDPLNSTYYGQPAGGYFCGDVQTMPDGRRIAAVESRSRLGFALTDLTDAAHPKRIGELVMRTTTVYDLAVVPDGRHIVLATEKVDLAALVEARATGSFPGLAWQTPCGTRALAWRAPEPAPGDAAEDPAPRPSSLLLVDISDPEAPAIVDHHPLFGEGHSVFCANLGGRTWILATTHGMTNPSGLPVPVPASPLDQVRGHMTGYEFYEVTETPLGARLGFLNLYKPPATDGSPLGPRGHDAWMAVHPVTGQLLAYLVGGDRFTILDVSDIRSLREVSRWTDAVPGREGYSASLHSVVPLAQLWEGRHYTIVGPEFHGHPDEVPSGIVWVLDTTDPAQPVPVAGWTLPHEVEWTGEYMFSNHYLNVQGRTLFVSMYHGGIWAVDLGAVLDAGGEPAGREFTSLPSIGVFMPTEPTIDPVAKNRWTPTLEEVLVLGDGTLATFDGWTGVWTFTFDEAEPMPAPQPWPLTPP